MKRYSKSITAMVIASLTLVMMFAGCSTSGDQKAGADADVTKSKKEYKFVYICKKLTDDWFKEENAGMKKKADELGAVYNGIDCDYKDERLMQAVDNVIAQGVDAVAICATNQGLGSAISKKFKEANIPFLTVDDTLIDDEGKPVPYVGVPTKQAGIETGIAMVKAAKDRKFFEQGNKYRIMIAEMAQITTCHEMALGYKEEFMKEIPGLKESDIVTVDVKDGSFDSSMAAISAAFNANPGVTHWIIATVDDYPAFASVKVLQENKFDFKNVLVSGFGAYQPSLDIFNMGGDIKNSYFSMGLNPSLEGEKAIQFLYDKVVNGKEIPAETRLGGEIIDASNLEKQFPDGKIKKVE